MGSRQWWRVAADYLLAAAIVGAALLLRLALEPVLQHTRPYLTVFGGIALAVWLTRWKPAAVAALVGFLVAHRWFAGAEGSLAIDGRFAAEFLAYALSAGFIVFMGESLHRAKQRAERDALERRAAEQSQRTLGEQFRVTIASIGDAVMTTDAQGRVTGLNAVAEAVTGWSHDEARGRPLDAVFRIVNEKTRDPVESPAARALREGVIVGLANHTVLIRKDGTERPIDDSAAPIRDARGDVIGCVLVFRDITVRRLAERQLWESREQLRITLASIGDGVIVTDAAGRIHSINGEAERLTGWSDAEAAGLPHSHVFRIMNEDTGQQAEDPVEKVLRLAMAVGLGNHTVLVAKDGTHVPIDDSAAPIREPGGPVLGVVLIFRDVTDQRAAQRANARLAAIVEHSGDAIFAKDLDGVVRSWNRAAERLFGYSASEMIGESIKLLVPRDRLHEETEILARLRAGTAVEQLETIRVAKDGRAIPVLVSVSPLRDPDGRVVGASAIVHDITSAIAAREALRESEERFRRMADAAPVLIWLSGTDKLCTWFNAQWLDFVGRSMEQEIGNGWAENVHPDDFDRCLETYVAAFDARRAFSMTYRLRRHDGEYRWILDNGVPRHDTAGEFVGYIGSCVDITERQRSEAALHEIDRRKDEFLAVLSHELRNPLAPIRMAAGLMRKLELGDPRVYELRDMIDRQTGQLSRLLDDLLDVSRITSGKIVLRKERASLNMAVASAVESIRPQIDARGQGLIVDVPEEEVFVLGDLARLAQIIANLLSNASKYTHDGGRIVVSATREDGRGVVRVRDTGVGLSREQMPKIFDMFTQMNASPERGQGGLGVGLALAKTLVEQHGGRIDAASPGPGQGSEFTVRLPLFRGSNAVAPEPPGPSSGPVARRRVLIADDNQDSAQVLAIALRHFGHQVEVAFDGHATVQTAERFSPEVAILDIGMPKLNGYDVARALRSRFGERISLVAVTGWGKLEDKRRANEAGFDHHLTKPIDIEAIAKLLSAAPPANDASRPDPEAR